MKQRMIAPGNLIFQTGAFGPPGDRVPEAAGDIVFMHAEEEWMRVRANGVVTIRGQQVDNDEEVYARFKAWLLEATYQFDKATEYKAADAYITVQAGKAFS
jgi:hypothetical protein